MRVITLTLLVVFLGPAPAAAAWRLPVSGPVSRAFAPGANPFAGGHHRGIDLAAPPGSPVIAPCRGRVVVAGRVGSSGGVVTVLCGRWRASLLPLSTILVRRGETVSARTRVGTLARSAAHAGLHVGVRRDGARFGYVDPLRFLRATRTTAPPPLGRAPRTRPRAPLAAPLTPVSAPAPRPLRGLAPWPAWVGLGLALAGVGVRWRWRRRGHRLGAAAAEPAAR